MANFCRSPVAEYLVKHFHSDKYDASSYGINPILKTHMDPRSIKFLDEKNIKTEIHSPKKISSKVMEDAYKVFAMDEDILFQLNKNFTKQRDKITLFTSISKTYKSITDPYRMNDEEYREIMLNIFDTIKNNL